MKGKNVVKKKHQGQAANPKGKHEWVEPKDKKQRKK